MEGSFASIPEPQRSEIDLVVLCSSADLKSEAKMLRDTVLPAVTDRCSRQGLQLRLHPWWPEDTAQRHDRPGDLSEKLMLDALFDLVRDDHVFVFAIIGRTFTKDDHLLIKALNTRRADDPRVRYVFVPRPRGEDAQVLRSLFYGLRSTKAHVYAYQDRPTQTQLEKRFISWIGESLGLKFHADPGRVPEERPPRTSSGGSSGGSSRQWLQEQADKARRDNPSLITGAELERRRAAAGQEQADSAESVRQHQETLAELKAIRRRLEEERRGKERLEKAEGQPSGGTAAKDAAREAPDAAARERDKRERALAEERAGHEPTLLATIDKAVRDVVTEGRIVFNPATNMRQGHSERVEVAIARSTDLDQELLASLRSTTNARVETITTSAFMGVDLRGAGFEITALAGREQLLHQTARWEFDVLPDAAARGDYRFRSPCGSPSLTAPTRRCPFPFWSAASA